MLTVLIETHNDEEALARTLSSLVSAAVEGIVREVLVCDRASSDQTAVVADHAGCTVFSDGDMAAALRRAKGEWLLLVEPGARLAEGWTEAAMAHMAQLTGPARFTRSRIGQPPLFTRLFSRARPLAEGLLLTRRQAVALLKGTDLSALKRLSARRLPAEIIPSPRRR